MNEFVNSRNNLINKNTSYADFGTRLLAYVIDFLIIFFIQSLILNPFFISIGMLPDISHQAKEILELLKDTSPEGIEALQEAYMNLTKTYFIPVFLVDMAVQGAYFIFMESSAKRGTIGKIAMGLTVTDMEGKQLTPFRAAGRYFSKYLSKFLCYAGYFFLLFTGKKQALHDLIAGTIVLKNKKETEGQE